MSQTVPAGMLIAAPASGSGKTVLTLGLLRALRNAGHAVCSAKAGPDYIDPGYHEIACGLPAVNLDPWAMVPDRIRSLAASRQGSHLVVEAMMGLFDGAADGSGSAADLAAMLDLPVVLVMDCARQSHSVAAVARGFRDHRPGLPVAGVILNRVGSSRHEAMLRQALGGIDMPVVGAVPRDAALTLPERHLGLVQAGEITEIEDFIEGVAAIFANACDLERLSGLFLPLGGAEPSSAAPVPPPGQRVAIAMDDAFSFFYRHLAEDWAGQGADLSFFSPLADEGPKADCDAVFLPGGYPELHAETLANAARFRAAMGAARERGARIHGECGGYMVLGEGLVDRQGKAHGMLGFLKLETSFENPRLHLGYRRLVAKRDCVFGDHLAAHEFHYTTAMREQGEPLFAARDALGQDLGNAGLADGSVSGSYMHIIDRAG